MSKLLDLDELNRVEEPYSRAKNIDTYNYILEQCHKKIIEFNRVHRSKFCYYKPPLHLINKPMYNYFDLINFLLEQLHNNGLYCQYVKSEGIYICWDPQVLNQTNYQNELANRQEYDNDNNNKIPETSHGPNRLSHKTKPRSTTVQTKKNVAKKNVSKVVDILKIEGDEFPVNIDGLRI